MNARWLRGSWPVTMLAAAVALVTLSPLLWMVSVSFMAPGEAASFPPPLLPSAPTLENYRTLFVVHGISRYFANSVLLASLATVLALLFVVPAGYAFAKLRFSGRDAVFKMLVAALVVPGQIGMLPLFLELKAMGLVNSYAGALVPWLAGIFGIFLVRQYCLSLPDEMLEAAPASLKDAKTFVQEWALGQGLALPYYEVLERQGLQHAPKFTVGLRVGDFALAEGKGTSKQMAEKAAAQAFIAREGLRT